MAKASVEDVKRESEQLRGTLSDQLAAGSDHFEGGDAQLLKFHGIYQQDDRDARKDRNKQGLGPLYFFMVRSKLPGGKLTADQYLAHHRLSDEFANGTLRLTSRQGIQLHGVLKGNLRNSLQGLNKALVSTLAACGDVERNVMSCPAPIRDNPLRDQMQSIADKIAEHLCPRTRAYHEIWLNGEREKLESPPKQAEDEPIYGKTYLPRKFKTAIAIPEDNCVDVLCNDAALLVRHRNGSIEGIDISVGGGQGMTHGKAKTYPRLATPLCFANPDELLDVLTAIVKVQRDHGNREDRTQARLKYLVDRWGTQKFFDTVQEYLGRPLQPHRGTTILGYDDHLGWNDQGDGKKWLGLPITAGRIIDRDSMKLKSGLYQLVSEFRPSVRITAQQNILLCDLNPADQPRINKILRDHSIATVADVSNLLRQSMACPAVPTCHLALSESERALPRLIGIIDAELARLGLSKEDILFRMTGCPNGCARPYNCDIGVVGRQPGVYTIFLGGNRLGTKLSFQYRDLVKEAELGETLRGPLTLFKQHRLEGEQFGDFCQRLGRDSLSALPSP